jgi:hypothetical protein
LAGRMRLESAPREPPSSRSAPRPATWMPISAAFPPMWYVLSEC